MPSDTVFHTIREQIADHIRREVMSGELAGGEPLREHDLAARFGVSRGPIRDALLQLTQEGLLVAKPNCGVKVREAPREELQPLIVDVRRRVEAFALRQGFQRLSGDALPRLEATLEQLKAACGQGDMQGVVEHDMALHRSIVQAADDEDLVAVWLPVVIRMMLHYTRHEDLTESYREHAAIVNAIRAGDKRAAVNALKENIQ